MRAFATVMLSLTLFVSTSALAQEALTITTPPGKLLVWDPEFLAPVHDPETEMVAFRLMASFAESGDLPFFVDREGIVVPRMSAEAEVSLLFEGTTYVVLVCSFPQLRPYNVALPQVRSEFCTLRSAERQP